MYPACGTYPHQLQSSGGPLNQNSTNSCISLSPGPPHAHAAPATAPSLALASSAAAAALPALLAPTCGLHSQRLTQRVMERTPADEDILFSHANPFLVSSLSPSECSEKGSRPNIHRPVQEVQITHVASLFHRDERRDGKRSSSSADNNSMRETFFLRLPHATCPVTLYPLTFGCRQHLLVLYS